MRKVRHQPSARGAGSAQLAQVSRWPAGDGAWERAGRDVCHGTCAPGALSQGDPARTSRSAEEATWEMRAGWGEIKGEGREERAESLLDPGPV